MLIQDALFTRMVFMTGEEIKELSKGMDDDEG